MERWQAHLADSITNVDDLASRFTYGCEGLGEVVRNYPLRITPYYLGLIREVGDPIWRQCVPDPLELTDLAQVPDPLDEENLSPVPGLIHRYPDRVVWTVSNACAVYCRFCMRKRHVGCHRQGAPSDSAIVDYISSHPEIRDVILSGGDPLLLTDDRLEDLLSRLRRIPHVEIIRLGTRVPVTLPARITSKLCRMLRRFQPLYINTHFNHPWEVTPEASRACARLADCGFPLGNQTVLLSGVNDDPSVMKLLVQRLLAIRVRPYYIHQMDLVRGTAHFRTPISVGLSILEGLGGHTSGLAVPHFVIDLPGGKGKVPLLPGAVERRGDTILLRSYRGESVEYRDASSDTHHSVIPSQATVTARS